MTDTNPLPGAGVRGRAGKLPPNTRRLSRTMARSIGDYGLIEAGDRIMVCLSGGKDSYTLFDLLWELRRRSPVPFDLIGVHLDQGQPGYDGAPLRRWLEQFGAPYEILSEDTYTTVVDLVPQGKTYCSVCSRLRRGLLYGAAERLGCNKLALGHHRDDALETLLMNLFYSGKLQAMPAIYTTDDGKFEVIRPLIECAEKDILTHAAWAGYPILPCNLCGSQSGLRREAMTALMDRLEADHPNLRSVMLNAIKNVHPSHLLDRHVARVWLARPRDEAMAPPTPSGTVAPSNGLVQIRRAAADPVAVDTVDSNHEHAVDPLRRG